MRKKAAQEAKAAKAAENPKMTSQEFEEFENSMYHAMGAGNSHLMILLIPLNQIQTQTLQLNWNLNLCLPNLLQWCLHLLLWQLVILL